ncbi:MAG TPA: hypothetical protein VGY31_04580 [Terriglobia bacterium]|nr:hypothetical protein [Terriglobia bacterium]
MKDRAVKPGQIWRSNEDGIEWLVTRTYSEFLDSYAVLRRAGGTGENSRRVLVADEPQGQVLPGFTLIEG